MRLSALKSTSDADIVILHAEGLSHNHIETAHQLGVITKQVQILTCLYLHFDVDSFCQQIS